MRKILGQRIGFFRYYLSERIIEAAHTNAYKGCINIVQYIPLLVSTSFLL
jgi:hypothetical protein